MVLFVHFLDHIILTFHLLFVTKLPHVLTLRVIFLLHLLFGLELSIFHFELLLKQLLLLLLLLIYHEFLLSICRSQVAVVSIDWLPKLVILVLTLILRLVTTLVLIWELAWVLAVHVSILLHLWRLLDKLVTS